MIEETPFRSMVKSTILRYLNMWSFPYHLFNNLLGPNRYELIIPTSDIDPLLTDMEIYLDVEQNGSFDIKSITYLELSCKYNDIPVLIIGSCPIRPYNGVPNRYEVELRMINVGFSGRRAIQILLDILTNTIQERKHGAVVQFKPL